MFSAIARASHYNTLCFCLLRKHIYALSSNGFAVKEYHMWYSAFPITFLQFLILINWYITKHQTPHVVIIQFNMQLIKSIQYHYDKIAHSIPDTFQHFSRLFDAHRRGVFWKLALNPALGWLYFFLNFHLIVEQ